MTRILSGTQFEFLTNSVQSSQELTSSLSGTQFKFLRNFFYFTEVTVTSLDFSYRYIKFLLNEILIYFYSFIIKRQFGSTSSK